MISLDRNTVTTGLSFAQLGFFAVEWANDADPAGKNVRGWTEGVEDAQWQELDWGDTYIHWEPKTFPKNGQARLQGWLREIIKGRISGALRKELDSEVTTIRGTFGIEWVENRGGPLMLPRMTGSPLAIAALGVMALASPELHERFGQCEWCERYFLETGVRRGPTRRRYCPNRSCDNAARQNKWRGGSGKRGGL